MSQRRKWSESKIFLHQCLGKKYIPKVHILDKEPKIKDQASISIHCNKNGELILTGRKYKDWKEKYMFTNLNVA